MSAKMILCDLERIEDGWRCKRPACGWIHRSADEPIVRCLTDPLNPFSPLYKKPVSKTVVEVEGPAYYVKTNLIAERMKTDPDFADRVAAKLDAMAKRRGCCGH